MSSFLDTILHIRTKKIPDVTAIVAKREICMHIFRRKCEKEEQFSRDYLNEKRRPETVARKYRRNITQRLFEKWVLSLFFAL